MNKASRSNNHAKLDELLKECDDMFENPQFTGIQGGEDSVNYSFLKDKYMQADTLDISMPNVAEHQMEEQISRLKKALENTPHLFKLADNIASADIEDVKERVDLITQLVERS